MFSHPVLERREITEQNKQYQITSVVFGARGKPEHWRKIPCVALDLKVLFCYHSFTPLI